MQNVIRNLNQDDLISVIQLTQVPSIRVVHSGQSILKFANFPLWLLWVYEFAYEDSSEAAIERWSYVKVFWKYAAIVQENTHVKVRLQ